MAVSALTPEVLQRATSALSDGALKMWLHAVTSGIEDPEAWTVDVLHDRLGFPRNKIAKVSRELLDHGYLERQIISEMHRNGLTSRWYFKIPATTIAAAS